MNFHFDGAVAEMYGVSQNRTHPKRIFRTPRRWLPKHLRP